MNHEKIRSGSQWMKVGILALGALSLVAPGAAFAEGDFDEDGCETTESTMFCYAGSTRDPGCAFGEFRGQDLNECGGTGTVIKDNQHTLSPNVRFGGEFYLTAICTTRDGQSRVQHVHATNMNQVPYLGCGGGSMGGFGQTLRIVCGPVPKCATKQP